ncbi:ArnT family glycosyltransferase [Altererythrobacter lauratis]|uniref:ArnT family glycosyltransferase n=1 Tax=Alteraurantiacibacter lauratis TaxID=2054627 RepID=A0ABV7EDY2_9SPHN
MTSLPAPAMDAGATARSASPRPSPLAAERWLLPAALVLVLALQLPLVLHRAINWDEFWHYNLTVLAAQGQLDQPLQTFFTRFFMWVPGLPGNPVDHIVLIRLFMLGCEVVVLACIAAIAGRFSDRNTGLLCALAYLSSIFVFQHGTSFRYDPQATALLMGSLWVLVCRPATARWMVLAGVLGGLAAMITIKSVLYAPVFAGVFWLRWNENGRTRAALGRLAIMVLAAAITFAAVYLWHTSTIVEAPGSGAGDLVRASGEKMFSLTEHLYLLHNLKGAIFSPVMTLLALACPFAIALAKRPAAERAALAGFWLPLTTLGFYHNTAPYFHVFMLAPVAVSLAAIMPAVMRRYDVKPLAATFVLLAAMLLWREGESPIGKQREIIATASQIFGEPVSYFDSSAMLGQFRKANPFMTPWGVHRYLRGEFPSMTATMERQVVPLVVENDPLFTQALRTREDVNGLLPQDLAALRETYIPFWGPLWIAGFDLPAGSGEQTVLVRVPGPYTVHGDAGVIVNGMTYQSGSVLTLERGMHRMAAPDAAARLVWGDRLAQPAQAAPAEPYFMGF